MVQKYNGRRIGLSVLLVSLIVLSGCVTVSVNSEVGSDATIESYEIEMTMSQRAYNYLEQSASSEGYSSVKEYMLAESFGNVKNNSESMEYSESSEGANKTITVRFDGYTPSSRSPITVRKLNETTMLYTDRTFISASEQSSSGSIPVHYTLTMPGEITNSTADSVEGDTATWDLSGAESARTVIYAESKISSGFGMMTLAAIGVGSLTILGLVIGGVLFYRSEGLPTV
jgi:hypothetical protein